MTREDKFRFAKVIGVLEEFYDKELSKDVSALYFEGLGEYSIEQIEAAAKEIIRTKAWFPKLVDFTEILGGKKDQGLAAWIKFMEALKTQSPYDSIQFADPAINDVIEFMGGWPAACLWTNEELKWKEKDFVGLYAAMRGAGKVKYLPGAHEQGGGRFSPPILIGAPEGQKLLTKGE